MAVNPESGEPYNKNYWESYSTADRNAAETDWREKTGAFNFQDYMLNRAGGYRVSLGTTYSEPVRSAELKNVWEQVITAIVNYSWQAIYAETPQQYNEIVAEMISVTKEYGYDQCIEWSENEAQIRKALEDEVRALIN
jgi:multiple sugar transport system substrate-binding protein/putative aldouronate transport system substrate-binding protein